LFSPRRRRKPNYRGCARCIGDSGRLSYFDTSGGVNSSKDDPPPTTTAPTLLTSPEPPRTALSTSLPTQGLLPPESRFAVRLTKGGAPTGNLQPGESLEADAEPSEGLSDPLPSPATQLDPSTVEMEPRKPAAVTPSEEEPHCNNIMLSGRRVFLSLVQLDRAFSASSSTLLTPLPLGSGNGVRRIMRTKVKQLLVLPPSRSAIVRFCVHGKSLKAVLMNRH